MIHCVGDAGQKVPEKNPTRSINKLASAVVDSTYPKFQITRRVGRCFQCYKTPVNFQNAD